jgi:LuxR family maltose regulon positive regulatory protein
LQVLSLLAEGHTNQEIARTLYISVNTVKAHLKNIYGKLAVNSRRQAVAEAHKLDLLSWRSPSPRRHRG